MNDNSIKILNSNHSLQFALMKRKETIKLLINTIQTAAIGVLLV